MCRSIQFLEKYLIMKYSIVLFVLMYSLSLPGQTTLTLSAEKDNTMYSEADTLSNGMGIYLFAGRTNGTPLRRGLISFDVSSIPSTATITSVELTFRCSKSTGTNTLFIHKCLNSWGEGASNAVGTEGQGAPAELDDATWLYNYYDTSTWISTGGDFESIASDSRSFSEGQTGILSGQGLVNDVQSWVSGAVNNGWVMLGQEGLTRSALRFNSSQNSNLTPSLKVTYTNCLVTVNLSGVIESGEYSASDTINATGIIPSGANVIFEAPTINLNLNFQIDSLAVFSTSIVPCS
jgi:hypothetical protein